MKIVIPGGSGQVGTILARAFTAGGHTVVVLSRRPAAAPWKTVPNAEFLRALRRAWGTRVGLPAPRWLLEVGAFLMRTETELVLKSCRVVPGRLLDAGFSFEFPTWDAAAVELVRRWRGHNR